MSNIFVLKRPLTKMHSKHMPHIYIKSTIFITLYKVAVVFILFTVIMLRLLPLPVVGEFLSLLV